MKNKNEISRLTADIPKECHIKLKSISVMTGKSIKEIIIELIENIDIDSFQISKDKKLQKIYKSLVKEYEPALKKLAKN